MYEKLTSMYEKSEIDIHLAEPLRLHSLRTADLYNERDVRISAEERVHVVLRLQTEATACCLKTSN